MVKWVAIGGLFVLFVSAVFLMREENALEAALLASEFRPSVARQVLVSEIQRATPGGAYSRVKMLLVDVSSVRQHSVSHIFGEVLYKEVGISGMTVCDSSFGFGCYHGFFGSAVAREGEGIVKKLDDLCVARYGVMGLGCPHGIGHGLGEYFGPQNIESQLAHCEALSWKGRFFGCQGGVFMEYNQPTTVQNEAATTSVRAYEESHPYGICLEVPARFQPACLLEVSGWWEQAIGKDYTRMDVLCNALEGHDNRESCFLGIGYSLAQSNGYDVTNTKESCAQMNRESDELLCLAGASWSFFANPAYKDKAEEVCSTAQCQQKADLLSYE
jgi:hypothetical protein